MGRFEKDYERKAQIAKTKKNFKNYLDRYSKQEEQLIALAAEAKKEGRELDYKQTLVTLKYISSGKRKMSKYLYQIELVEILADEAQMGKDFVSLMSQVGKDTAEIYKNIDLNKTKEISKNASKIASQQATFNEYLSQLAQLEDDHMESDVQLDKELEDKIYAMAGIPKEEKIEIKEEDGEVKIEENSQTKTFEDEEKDFFASFE